ncbi:MAG: hypothetical protein FWD24_06745, partial [Treponema sp.]|nr:hypothetical protein [Treponema sp.]
MKNESFRPVDFWKSTLMTMADNLFFELIRSVFGKIKTPFNKQQLLNDLEAFLLSDEIQKTIGSYIDKSDRKIIAAIAILNEPSFEQMQNFFSGEVSFAQLQDIIVNLEERFILYRFTEEKPNVFKTMSLNTNATKAKTCLALNPVLKPVLLPITNETSVLFSTEDEAAEKIDTPVTAVETTAAETTAAKPAAPVMNDLLLAALYSFTYGFDSFYVPEGQIRKRVKQEAKTLFPGLDIEKTFGILQVMGLFYIKEEKIIPEKKYFEDFISISSFERMEYFAAAIIVYSDLNPTSEILPPLYKNKIREAVNFIHNFIQSITSDSEGIPEKNLRRIIEVLKVQTDSGTDIKIDTFFDALERTGLIVKTENGLYKSGAGLFTKEQEKQNSPVIAVDSGFSILVYPEINFNDLIKLASILDISKTDPMIGNTVARFELGKDSAVRSFDNNTTADEIIELLTRLSGEGVKSESSKLNDSIIFNLKDWEKRHKEVSLKKGVVLSLSEEHR